MNVVADRRRRAHRGAGHAEGAPVPRDELDALLDLALGGIRDLTALQSGALAQPLSAHAGDPLKL
jgi:ribonuclease PH